MASRDGPRASGTDGSDFSHRQRVASHYKESVLWKGKLKACLCLHLFLIVAAGGWIAAAYNGMVKDQPKLWQAAWLLSALPTVVGLLSLPKNNTKQLYIYAFATLFIGVGPLAFGACVMVQEIFYNVSQGRAPATQEHQMAPMKMALSAFLIQFHGISLYYANKLITAWSSKGEKKNS
ncbi:protein jagunal homolog 1-like [Pocillopora verrucosa]|uniref:protein jagunal homolog 1-like n=1 Tax=Pocillopora verrucosa TaxID=203993 RepID=UPI002797614F|nr:protein jagunal homolog 1-like [Pocillopora verrucosa]